MDDTKARIKVDSARTALEIAEAELERTRIGSVYVLEKERPEQDAIRLQVAQDKLAIKEELDAIAEKLFVQKVISREEMMQRKMDNIQRVADLQEAELSLK